MKNINLLLLGAGNRLEFIKIFNESAEKAGVSLNFYCYENELNTPVSSYCEVIRGLNFDNRRIISHISKIIVDKKIDICFALNDKAVRILPHIKEICFAPSPSKAFIEIFTDKKLMDSYLRGIGLNHIPRTQTPPLIVKPNIGSASKGIFYVKNKKSLSFEIKTMSKNPKFLSQKWLSGPEYSVDIFITQQNLVFSCTRKRIKINNGECVLAKIEKINDILRQLEILFSTDEIRGPLNVQFIYDKNLKKFYISDINPRFGGGMTLSYRAGIDWPRIVLDDFLGKNQKKYKVRSGKIIAKYYQSTIVKA